MRFKTCVILLYFVVIMFSFSIKDSSSAQWETIGPWGGDQFHLKISPGDPNTMFTLADFTSYRSLNGGQNWHPITTHEDMLQYGFLALAFDPEDVTHIFLASTLQGVWESHDQGDTWTNCSDGLPMVEGKNYYYPVASLAYDSNGRLYAGLDEYEGHPPPPALIYSCDGNCGGWQPDDAGIDVTISNPTQNIIALFSVDRDNNLWTIVYGSGVYLRQNGAWVSRNGDLPGGALRSTFLQPDPLNSSHLILGTEFNWLYETSDGGQTWIPSPLPDELMSLSIMPLVYAITIDPNNSQVVFVDASDSFGSTEQPLFRPLSYQKSGGNAYITLNGGQEWLAYPPPFFRTTIDAGGGTVADDFPPFGPVTRSKVWYRTSGAFDSVQKSDDGALTFEVINKGINGVFVNNIWLHPSPPAPYTSMLLVAVEEQLLFLTDTDDTWPRQRPAHGEQYTWSFDADYYNPDAVYYSIGYPAWNLIGQIGVHRLTFDCFGPGCSPGEVLLGDTGVWRVFTTPLEPKLIYAACQDKGIMISYNRGRKWYELNLGFTLPKSISDIVFDEGGLPFLAAARTSNGDLSADPPHHWNPTPDEKGGVYRINPETAKWELLPDITSATLDLEFDPRNRQILYAATALGVYKTTDGGDKWERVSLPLSIFDLLVDPLKPDNVYAATANAGVWLSTDSGEHWGNISQGLLEKMVLSLALDPETGILYAGTGGNSVYQLVPDGNP